MTFRGHVKGNGVVVLDDPSGLPEGSEVEVSLIESNPPAFTASEGLMSFAGKATGLPEDASENLDHYLYGSPKR